MSPQDAASDHQAVPSESAAGRTAAAADVKSPRRALVAGLLFGMLAVVILVFAVRAICVSPIPELTEAELDRAEQLWSTTGPAGYDMDLVLRGAQPGSIHIEVRNSQVTTMTRDGRVPPQRTWDTWSVPGQFDTLERELELAEDPVHEMDASKGTQLFLRCSFDPRFGFPRQYHRYVVGGGPEVYWHVTHFTPK